MRAPLALLALLGSLSGTAAAGAETAWTLPAFEGLTVDTAMSVTVACGRAPRMAVRADPPVVAERYLDVEIEAKEMRLHFRRDFDRHVHPDQVAIVLTLDRPLRRLTATTGARVAMPPCALPPDGLVVRVETGARVELAGTTGLLELTVLSGGTVNALGGGRDFFPDRVRLTAGAGSRVGLCGARAVAVLSRAADARVLTAC